MNIDYLLSMVLQQVKQMPVDQGMLKKPEYVCNVIKEAAKSIGSCIATFENGIYIFNSTHWEKLPDIKLKALLAYSYCAILNDYIVGMDYNFNEKLKKQIPYTTLLLNTEQAEKKINFSNGTLDLDTGVLNPHDWKDFFRYVLPYDYDPNARYPMFEAYLNKVMPDASAQMVLAEYIGWLFAKNLKLEKVLFLYGKGCNGKSVFLDIIEALVGYANVSHESISDMCGGERGANHRANIIGKMLNVCSDVAPNAFAGDLFKRMASREAISAKVLYSDVITTTDYPIMIFALNELPKTSDTSNGYYRRFIIAPFNVQIPKKEIDTNLAQKIIKFELPGIMNWALQGRNRLIYQGGFSCCSLFDKANEDYRNASGEKKRLSILLPPLFK